MSGSLLGGLTGLITPDVAGKAASMLGESEAAIRKAVSGMFPALLSNLASRSENPGFAALLFELMRSPANDGSVLVDIGSLFSANGSLPMMNLGRTLLGSLFGDGTGNFANQLAGYAGIKISTAKTLLNVAAPLVLASLGKRARHEGLNAFTIATLLHGEKHFFSAAVPSQLSNLGRYRGNPDTEPATHTPPIPKRRASVLRWLLPALAAIVGFALYDRKEQLESEAIAPNSELLEPRTVAPIATVYFDIDQSAPRSPAGHRAHAVRSTWVAAGIEAPPVQTRRVEVNAS